MSGSKKLVLIITLLCIIIIGLFTALLDFSRLSGSYALYYSYPNEMIKRINVFLAALLVWLAGKDSLNPQDNLYMKSAFLFICCGEIFFLLSKPAAAIGFFAFCQGILIKRHSLGFWCKIKKTSILQKSMLALSLLALIFLIYSIIIILYPRLTVNILLIIAACYGVILSISLWMGLTNYILGLHPCKNAKMIALGMSCFYFCDISVGLDGLLQPGTAWLLATSLIWVFYTPAITLLALSCYKYLNPHSP